MVAQLLPPNASPFERSLEQAMAFYGDERDVLVGDVWDPAACPVHVLPWLAWALAVRRWDPAWPEAVRRTVVARSVARHRIRGTLGAVKAALEDAGAIADVTERPGDVDFTMAIDVYNSTTLLGETDAPSLRDYIDDVKRFSVHYQLNFTASLDCSFILFAAGVAGVQVADFMMAIGVEPIAPPLVPNQLPTARTGANQAVAAGAVVTLDASTSSDPDGSIATYLWEQLSGTTVALSSTAAAMPTFTAPTMAAAQTLEFRVTVTDDRGGQATDTVDVDVAASVNQLPTARTGANQAVAAGAVVTLDASTSSDPDGSIATYLWEQLSGTTVALSSTAAAMPTFTAPTMVAAQTLEFRVTVTDDRGGQATDTVDVDVAASVNQLPTARTGANQAVAAGAVVTLDASTSSDPDGSIATYLWEQLSGTTVALSSTAAAMPTFTAPTMVAAQTLEFRVTVTDDRGGQATDTVDVDVAASVNQLPTARTGANQAVAAGAVVTLDASTSSDPDGSIATYLWEQLSGTTVALSSTAAAMPTFTAPTMAAAQTLEFRVTVTDDRGGQATDTVDVDVAASPSPASTSFRFDSLEALREFGTFVDDGSSDQGRWELIGTGSGVSSSTQPGTNSARPYVASDSSSGTVVDVVANSAIDLAVEMNWAAPTGRVLRLRCAVIGNFSDAGEGLLVQGRETGGTWEDISLIRGWIHSNSYSAGDDMTDYDGATIPCTQDGGWADFDIAIPDAHDDVRLRVVASVGTSFQHDVALWSAELRTASLSLADWVLPAGRTQHTLMLCSAAARPTPRDDIYRHADNPPAAGSLLDGSDVIDFPGDDDSRVTRFRRHGDRDSELLINDNPDATLLRPNFEALTDPQLHVQTLDDAISLGVTNKPDPLGGNYAAFGVLIGPAYPIIDDLAEGDRFLLAITSEDTS